MLRKLPTEIATALLGDLAATPRATHLRYGPELGQEKCQIVRFHQIQSAVVCKSPSDYATLLNAFVIGWAKT